jgi:hypothetical protein
MSLFAILVWIIILFALLLTIIFYFAKSKPSVTEEPEPPENDELIFDEETGQYVKIEEFIESKQLDYLSDEKVEAVFNDLPEDIKSGLIVRDVENILEFYYQIKLSEAHEGQDTELTKLIQETYKRRGSPVSSEAIEIVVNTYEKLFS